LQRVVLAPGCVDPLDIKPFHHRHPFHVRVIGTSAPTMNTIIP
jgi:hypothetical protein